MIVELIVMEQRCQALSLVIQDGESVVGVARRFGVARQTVHLLGTATVAAPAEG